MSHLSYMKTQFQNLFYLKKALNKLNIVHTEEQLNSSDINLVIPQSNNYNIEFQWNGENYELVVDLSFWDQSYSVKNFMDKIAQQYAGEVIIGESHKMGFQPVNYQENVDGSNTLVLERWNTMN